MNTVVAIGVDFDTTNAVVAIGDGSDHVKGGRDRRRKRSTLRQLLLGPKVRYNNGMMNAHRYLLSILANLQHGEVYDSVSTRAKMLQSRDRRAAEAMKMDAELKEQMREIGIRTDESLAERAWPSDDNQFISGESLQEGHALGSAQLQPLFANLLKEACVAARKMGLKVDSLGTIGVLPIGTPNALAISVPNSIDTLVVFQTGLPTFLNRLTKLVVSAEVHIPIANFDRIDFSSEWEVPFSRLIDASLDRQPELSERYAELMLCTLVLNDPNEARPHYVDSTTSLIRGALLHQMELFVIGHEIGHSALGHLKQTTARCALSIGAVSVEALTHAEQEEFEADMVGSTISDLVALSDCDEDETLVPSGMMDFRLAGPDFFFSCIMALEAVLEVSGCSWCTADSHPPTFDRREARRKLLLDHYDNRAAVLIGRRLALIIERLSARCAPTFEAAFSSGNTVSSAWRSG